jgi:hypothetical protein
LLIGLSAAQGGDDVPLLTGLFPAGATAGSTVDWNFSGRHLSKVKRLVISGREIEILDLTNVGDEQIKVKVRVAEDALPGFREVRLDGPSGVSNLAMVRIDRLKQAMEVEPNDDLAHAQPIEAGSAVVGVLKPLDVDHYRIQGAPGQKLTIDLEARRLGTSIDPVVSIFRSDGSAIAQGRESRGFERDCVMPVVLSADGVCLVQVRDNIFGGHERASYRLRIDPAPFATAVFPLGGLRGQTLNLQVSGGNLAGPLQKFINLPDAPGTTIDTGFVESPEGPIKIPGRIAVSDGPKIVDRTDRTSNPLMEIQAGTIVNGKIGKPGQVDSYWIATEAGERLQFRIEAASLGSWLDSVVTIRDAKGVSLLENDDDDQAIRHRQASPDSSIDFVSKVAGKWTIDVFDRFGDGGPEYPYRLVVERDRADFAVELILEKTNASTLSGAFQVLPGGTIPIHFQILPVGRPGPIEVSVEGLPPGSSAEPVRIRFPGPKSPANLRAESVADFLTVKVNRSAPACLNEIRLVARASPKPGVILSREATAVVNIETSRNSSRPILREIRRFPFRILGVIQKPD